MKKRVLKIFIVIALLSMFCFSGCDSPVSNDNSNSPASQLTSGTGGNGGNPSETVYSYDKLCNKIICECVSQGCSIQQIAEDATFANLYEKFAKSNYSTCSLWISSLRISSIPETISVASSPYMILVFNSGDSQNSIDAGVYAFSASQYKIWKLTTNLNFIKNLRVRYQNNDTTIVDASINNNTFLFRCDDNQYLNEISLITKN